MERERDTAPAPAATKSHTMFVPLLLIVIALLLMTGFQVVQLTREHEMLQLRLDAQTAPLEESTNVREQLQSIATSTATLAENGNENAQRIIEQLGRAGIRINADGQTAEDPAQ